MNDIISDYNLEGLISSRCKAPDHSLLDLQVKVPYFSSVENEDTSTQFSGNRTSEPQNRRYKFDEIPTHFLTSDRWLAVLENSIRKIENSTSCQENVNSLYSEICSDLFKEFDLEIPYRVAGKKSRKRFKNYKPYWNDTLTNLWKEMVKAEKLYHRWKSKNEKHILKTNFDIARKNFDKKLRNCERTYNRQLADQIEELNTENPREFWDHINKLGPKRQNDIPTQVYDANGNLNSDINFVKDKWKSDFESLFQVDSLMDQNFDESFRNQIIQEKELLENQDTNMENEVLNSPFTLFEITRAQNKLKNKKSTGSDSIPNEILKLPQLTILLLHLYNKCFSYGIIPHQWRMATIVPIPKSSQKDPYVPLNYRGISLLSCVYKLYSALLNNRLNTFCADEDVLVDEQNGFRKERSCIDHTYVLTSTIRNRMSEGLPTYCAFIDFQKAFDRVDRDLLMFKLLNYGINGKLYFAVKSIYSSSFASVRINNIQTQSFDIPVGVRQGDNLSPTLFSIFLNDLATGLKSLNCGVDINDYNLTILLYADDIVLLAPSPEKLQHQIDYVHQWCKKWRMKINSDKTQIVHFRPTRQQRSSFVWKFGDDILQTVSTYRYLGVFLHEHLDFKIMADAMSNAASRALGSLRYKLNNLKECRYDTITKLYLSCIVPILDYGASVWGYNNFSRPEAIQHRVIRYFLGVHRFAANSMIEGDMGWLPCVYRRRLAMLKFWNRLVMCNQNRLLYKVFIWDKSFVNSNSWMSEIKDIFVKINQHDCLPMNTKCDMVAAHTTISAINESEWENKRYRFPKLRYYNMYKSNFSVEEYVNCNMPKWQRSVLAQFRAGILPLEVETGRYQNIELQDRLCKFCRLNEVEDEIHFICQCTFYNEARNDLYIKTIEVLPDFYSLDILDKFVYLLANMQKQVAHFLSTAIKKRRDFLYSNQNVNDINLP